MLKFNLTQEGKTAIAALQGDAKLTITKVLLRGSEFDNNTSKEITSFKGAVCNDGTGNGAYVVIDINDNSNSNYSCNVIELFSDQTKIATQCANEQSGYEVTLSCGERGKNAHPSITYKTQTWASGKTPTNVQLSASMGNGKQCGISMFGGGVEGGSATFDFENGDFPKTITFANGDVWVTNETVSAAGVTTQADYYASSEMGGTSIRPLFSKVLIQKESNKQLKLRVSCQFDGAEKCKFNTTSINLPYATRFREGVIRLADPSEVYGKDGQRYNTVYSAADVDAKIDQVTESLGNLKDYAKKATENTFTENNTFEKAVIVHDEIRGGAVATLGMNANEKDAMVVSLGYANNKYLSKTEAEGTYLTQENAGTTYLSKADAETTYLTQTNAADTYLKKTDAETAAGNYAKLDGGNTFTGATNTFQEVSATKFSGNGVSSDISADAENNGTKLPTCAAVATFVDGKTSTLNQNITTLQEKDTDLQSQIDGINAGQNLADIVNNTTELERYDVSHLKAKDDFQRGTSGAKWAIGDKVQVLGGGEVQSSVYELTKGDMPDGAGNIACTHWAGYYWRYIGVYGTNAYTKSEIDAKVGDINTSIGTKADTTYVNTELGKKANSADVYNKSEADGKFAQLAANNEFTGNNTFTGTINTFNGVISGNAVTSDIATDAANQGVKLTTSTGVSNFVTKVVDDKIKDLQLGSSYLKLTSSEKQTVNSNVEFNGIISGTAVAAVVNQTDDDGRKLVTVDYANEKLAQLNANNTFAGATNTFNEITATTVSAQTFTGDGVAQQISSNGGQRLPTEDAVVSFVTGCLADNRHATSNKEKVGAMGLFLYTGGDYKEMGAQVNGALLQAVGMQLPMDGVVSWSQGAAMAGTWKLLNNTIAGEPCLVLAIKTA